MKFFCLIFLSFVLQIAWGQYDIIVVGLGSSSSIVLTKLIQEFPQKKFIAIELGGPTELSVGGTRFPPYFSGTPSSNKATINDVPGEYPNTAFQEQGEPFRISQTPFTFQGKGYGGNSQFNGMLYQEAPNDYLNGLPDGWKSGDLRPYFNEIRSKMTITTTPSSDGKTYLGGIHDVLVNCYNSLRWILADTSNLGPLGNPGYYSRPYVASNGRGQRGGPVSAYLSKVIGTNGRPSVSNLVVVGNAQVNRILFSSSDLTSAIGVVYTITGTSNQITVNLNAGGRVICGCGALMTPRLLYLSGIGPAGRERNVMDNPQVTFIRNNPRVGANVYDHVGTQLNINYKGGRAVQTIKYANYGANTAAINQYVNSRSGPYAQYGPVSVAQGQSDTTKPRPNFELFTNPFGPGGGSQFNTPTSFQIVSMFFRPLSTASLGLDTKQDVKFPNIYLSNDADANDQTNAISITINRLFTSDPTINLTLGPGSPANRDLNPKVFADVKKYVTSGATYSGVLGSRLIMNHYTGTVPLVAVGGESAGGVEPSTLRLRSTSNVHIVDASILPGTIPCHPIATIMAIGAKAADVIASSIRATSSTSRISTSSTTRTSSSSRTSSTSTSRITTSSSTTRVSTSRISTTRSSATPSSSAGPIRCGSGFCGGSDLCCAGQCYSTSRYVCTTDNRGTTVLCPVGNASCNGQCFNTSLYTCTDGRLQPR